MTVQIKSILISAVMAFAMINPAHSAETKARVRLDANQDGAINFTELQNAKRQRFAALDSNRDGVLVLGEFTTRRVQKRFARLDNNRDGRLSAQEWELNLSANFQRVDQNKNGVLEREELRAIRKHHRG
jgi:Ca2+-binding EF-hand superfamily protein